MKCTYCGASMPDPPRALTYGESYKELREEIGRLEFENEKLIEDKNKEDTDRRKAAIDKRKAEEDKEEVQNLLRSCENSLVHHQASETSLRKGKKIWKGIAFFLLVTNVIWLCMVVTLSNV